MSNYLLQKLRITGDIKFLPSEVTFNKGLSIIIGGNKSGKTTLLRLIGLLSKNGRSKENRGGHLNSAEMELKFYLTPRIINGIEMEPINISIKNGVIGAPMTMGVRKNKEILDMDSVIKILFINLQKNSETDFQIFKKDTDNIENTIILIDDIDLLSDEALQCWLDHIIHISRNNQVILSTLPDFHKKIETTIVYYFRDSEVLYLRGSLHAVIRNFHDLYRKDAMTPDPLREYHEAVKNILNIMKVPLNDWESYDVLCRLMYSNIITIMETYLSDCFTQIILRDKNLKLKLIASISELNEKKFYLKDAQIWLDSIDDNIIETLQNISFHNLGKVIGMYKNVLGVSFPDNLGTIFDSINTRHDIIHRNGKDKTGKIIQITRKDVESLVGIIDLLVDHIEQELSNLKLN